MSNLRTAHAAHATSRDPDLVSVLARDAPIDASDGALPAERNLLLRSLPAAAYARLLPGAVLVRLEVGQRLWHDDEPIVDVYFPRTSVCSLLTPMVDSPAVESATVGFEGLVGVPVVLRTTMTHTLAIAQVEGTAVRVRATDFRDWLDDAEPEVDAVFLRYAQALIEQTAQSVACNRRHGMEERCARWLLATRDRVGADRFELTHEYLAAMLGVRRASVTVAAGMLQRAGLIRYARGHITITDGPGLEAVSCECYRVVRAQHARLVGVSAA